MGPTGFHELHAVEWGDPDAGRVVVCAHGYSGNGRDFDYLARELAADAHVICPDTAGRGQSGWLSSPLAYHFPQFLADLRALMAKLGGRRVEWVGTSMGGLLGMMLAAEPHSPIERLVLNDIGAFVPGPALAALGRHLRAPGRFRTRSALARHVDGTHRDWGPMTDAHRSHVARHAARRLAGGYALHYDPRIAQILPTLFAPGLSLWSVWDRIRCPVLLIRGQDSPILPVEVAQKMLATKPQTRFVEIAGAGHAPSLMADDQIAAVAGFLAPRAPAGMARAA